MIVRRRLERRSGLQSGTATRRRALITERQDKAEWLAVLQIWLRFLIAPPNFRRSSAIV